MGKVVDHELNMVKKVSEATKMRIGRDTTKLWNSVPGDLVNLESDVSFKRGLRSYLVIT